MKLEEKRQAANCAPSKKSILFFDHLPISALVGSDSSEYSVRFHSGNLFFHRFGCYAYPFCKIRCA